VNVIRRVWRGLRYSDTYGSHPGTPWLIGLTFVGAVAGGIGGAVIMLAFLGPLYLFGAYERGDVSDGD
jgi:hypothetical protein